MSVRWAARLEGARIGGLVLLGLALAEMASALPTTGLSEKLSDERRWTRHDLRPDLEEIEVVAVVEDAAGVVWAATVRDVSWYDGYWWHTRSWDPSLRWGPGHPFTLLPFGDEGVVASHPGLGLLRVTADGIERLLPIGDEHGRRVWELAGLGSSRVVALQAGRDPDGARLLELTPDGRRELPSPPGLDDNATIVGFEGALLSGTVHGTFRFADAGWHPLWDEVVHQMVRDADGVRWASLATEPGRYADLHRIDGDEVAYPVRELDRPIAGMVADSTGGLLCLLDTGTLRVRQDRAWRELAPAPAPLIHPRSLFIDSLGDLWVGAIHGLYLNRLGLDRWTGLERRGTETLAYVNDLVRGPADTLWAATGGGVLAYDESGRMIRTIETIGDQRLRAITGLAFDGEDAMLLSSGSELDGFLRHGDAGWQAFTEKVDPRTGETRRMGAVHRLVPTGDGRVWVLSNQRIPPGADPDAPVPGIALWDPSRGQVIDVDRVAGRASTLAYAADPDPDGGWWFAGFDGLSRFVPDPGTDLAEGRGAWTHWTSADGLARDRVFTVAADLAGGAWFGHQDSHYGLGHLHPDGTISYVTVADGLIDEDVWDIDVTSEGVVWAATLGGLARIEDGVVAGLGMYSGIVHPFCWPVRVEPDQVILGTQGNGVWSLSRSGQATPPPRVRLEPVLSSDEGTFLRWRAAAYRGEQAPDRIRVRYRIDGGAWSPWTTEGEARLAGLSSGSHAVELETMSLFGTVGRAGTPTVISVPGRQPTRAVLITLGAVWLVSIATVVVTSTRRRRRMHRMLEDRERYFRSLIENTTDLILVVGPDLVVHYQSPSVDRTLGWSAVGCDLIRFLHPDDRHRVERWLTRLHGDTSSRGRLELRLEDRDGGWREFDLVAGPVRVDEAVEHLVLHGRDVTEQRQAEVRLRESEQKYRLLFSTDPSAVLVIDEHTRRILDVNEAAEALYGYTRAEMLGLTLDEIRADSRPVRTQAPGGRTAHHRRKDGRVIPVEVTSGGFSWSGRRIGFEIARDLSAWVSSEDHRERLERQLRHAQKMEALGTLAGSIAHDFNNILLAIQGYAELVLDEVPGDGTAAGHVAEVLAAAAKGRAQVDAILAFTARRDPELRVASVSEVVAEAVRLLRVTLPSSLEVSVVPADEPDHARLDVPLIQRMLLNLATNAHDAMPEGGCFTVSVGVVELTDPDVEALRIRPGRYVRITVADTGEGIPEAIRDRIFDPFFTTKHASKGTGLGLAVVKSTMRAHQGAVTVHSEVGSGTRFELTFPWIAAPDDAPTAVADPPDPARENGKLEAGPLEAGAIPSHHDASVRSGETGPEEAASVRSPDTNGDAHPVQRVLFVEDEEQLVKLGTRLLESLGYHVTAESAPDEALRRFRSDPDAFDLVVTDHTMPRLTGAALTRKLKEIRPRLPVVLVTGYGDEEVADAAREAHVDAVLPKPFTRSQLSDVIRRVIIRGGRASRPTHPRA